MGIEESHFGVLRIIVPCESHLDENAMPKIVNRDNYLVIEPEVITVLLTGFHDLPDCRIRSEPLSA